eukprot:6203262-Pleurochrysis_carterae.AAC.2
MNVVPESMMDESGGWRSARRLEPAYRSACGSTAQRIVEHDAGEAQVPKLVEHGAKAMFVATLESKRAYATDLT